MKAASTGKSLWWVLLVVFLIYSPSLGNGFALDSASQARGTTDTGATQPVVGELHGPGFYFSRNVWAGTGKFDGLYRPLPIYTYALTYNLLSEPLLPPGLEALPHHLLNILLHVLGVFLVFRLLLDLGCGPGAAKLAALVFGVHAIHSEVVVDVVGRAELLPFVCGMSAILLVGRDGIVSRLGAALLMFCAFCSKESALAFVAFLPCYELARGWSRGKRPWITRYLAAIVPALVAWYLLRHFALAQVEFPPREVGNLANPLAHVDYGVRFLTAIKVWGYGLWKCLCPYPLCSIYGLGTFALVDFPLDPGFLVAAIALLCLLLFGLCLARQMPLLFLAAALFLGFTFITSNLTVLSGTVFAERRLYIASLGICLLPALLASRLGPRGKRVLLLTVAVWAAGNTALILARTPDWRDSDTLFLHDVEVQPGSADLHDKVAEIHGGRTPPDMTAAMRHVERALEIYPQFPAALVKRGAYHARRSERDAALRAYESALHSPFNTTPRYRSLALRAQGSLLYEMGRQGEGLAKLGQAVATDPTAPDGFVILANLALLRGGYPADELRALMAEIARRFPKHPDLSLLRGLYLVRDGIQNVEQARHILRVLQIGLSALRPDQLHRPLVTRARVLAAECQVVLGDRQTATRIFAELLSDKRLDAAARDYVREARERTLPPPK